jgi:hypothetical protein
MHRGPGCVPPVVYSSEAVIETRVVIPRIRLRHTGLTRDRIVRQDGVSISRCLPTVALALPGVRCLSAKALRCVDSTKDAGALAVDGSSRPPADSGPEFSNSVVSHSELRVRVSGLLVDLTPAVPHPAPHGRVFRYAPRWRARADFYDATVRSSNPAGYCRFRPQHHRSRIATGTHGRPPLLLAALMHRWPADLESSGRPCRRRLSGALITVAQSLCSLSNLGHAS